MNPNSMDNFNAVIDLTALSPLAKPRRYLANTVIDLVDTTDESFNISIELANRKSDSVTKKSTKTRKRKSNCGDKCPNGVKKNKRHANELGANGLGANGLGANGLGANGLGANGLGDCPICWDQLGKNPLASTKCGHVYCFKCLEKMLKIAKTCPTCRRPLKRTSDYHPLYF